MRLDTDAPITFALAVFSLMQKKSRAVFNDLFNAVRQLLFHDHAGPEFMISDFEHAAILAHEKSLPQCHARRLSLSAGTNIVPIAASKWSAT